MPINKNALIRYRTIDQCLRNRQRLWTINDLVEACSEALNDWEGIDRRLSSRTLQLDIQTMRSGKLGYTAPIIVVKNKYYTYENPHFSIDPSSMSPQELDQLWQLLSSLKQFKGFNHFHDMEVLIQKMEEKLEITRQQRAAVIDFDRNEKQQGLEHLAAIHQAILGRQPLDIQYQPFHQSSPIRLTLHPYLLKEYQYRWYIVGFSRRKHQITILGLDRILKMSPGKEPFIDNNFFHPENYFKDVLGITVDWQVSTQEIKIFVDAVNTPYLISQPLHPSQKTIEKLQNGMVISLRVKPNFELKKAILSLGSGAVVLSPVALREEIKSALQKAFMQYDSQGDPT